MRLITFITQYENVNPKYKHAVIIGIHWGLWAGGIIAVILYAIIQVLLNRFL